MTQSWRKTWNCAGVALLICSVLAVGVVRADGFHAEVMTSSDPTKWTAQSVQQLQTIVTQAGPLRGNQSKVRAATDPNDLLKKLNGRGKPAQQVGNKDAQGRGIVAAQLSNTQRAEVERKSQEYARMLQYMDPQNIFPREFPNFPVNMVSQYRDSAKKLLTLTGEVGADVVVNALRGQLMTNPRGRRGQYGMKFHDEYARDLMEVLQNLAARGQLKDEHLTALRNAAAGSKEGDQAALAERVNNLLPELTDARIDSLLKWADDAKEAGDERRRTELLEAVNILLESATVEELARVYAAPDVSTALRRRSKEELAKRINEASLAELIALAQMDLEEALQKQVASAIRGHIPDADVIELLNVMEFVNDTEVIRQAARRVAKERPNYSDIKNRVGEVLQHLDSERRFVVQAATLQLNHIFTAAPIIHCLYWLGQDDPKANELIWKLVDQRVGKANAANRSAFRADSLKALEHAGASRGSRVAALRLLGRLRDRGSVTAIVERLPKLDRALWPEAGEALRRLTGQNFGPVEGDGLAEVVSIARKYRDWLAANPNKP